MGSSTSKLTPPLVLPSLRTFLELLSFNVVLTLDPLRSKHGRNADNYERNTGRRIDRPRMAKFKTSSPKALNAQADAHQGPELSSSGHARMAKRQRERLTDYEQSETLWT
jgi:hypothetical protein